MSAVRGVVLLAAGGSRRMGTPKALLPWAGTTLLAYAVAQAHAAAAREVVVVLGPATQHLRADLSDDIRTAFNPVPESGRSASIHLGTLALPESTGPIVIQSVDQPVSAQMLRALFEVVEAGGLVAVPTYAGRRGHPVCFAGEILPELRSVTEQEQGLRAVVRRHAAEVRELAVDDQSVMWNLNDRATYAAALAVIGEQ